MTATVLVAGCLAMTPCPTRAQGIDLSWDECGAAGSWNLSWACDANLPANAPPRMNLVASFTPPPLATPVTGIEAVVHWTAAITNAIPWWQFGTQWIDATTDGPPGCRSDDMVVKFDVAGLGGHCSDYFGTRDLTVASQVHYGIPDSWSGQVKVHVQVPADQAAPLDPSADYYAFYLAFDKLKTVGAGACDGCKVPMCIWLDYIDVLYADQTHVMLSYPGSMNFVAWQQYGAGCFPGDPVRPATWGRLKALYR